MPCGASGAVPDELVRRIKGVRGTLTLDVRCEPAFDYARTAPNVSVTPDGVIFEGKGLTLGFSTEVPFKATERGACGRFVLREGEKTSFVLRRIDPARAPAQDKVARHRGGTTRPRGLRQRATGGLHILRHMFCAHFAMRGAPAKAIQELPGHGDLMTTMRSMHLSPMVRASAIRLLNSRGSDRIFGEILEMRGDRRGSNPRQLEPQSSALPTELRPPKRRAHHSRAGPASQAPGPFQLFTPRERPATRGAPLRRPASRPSPPGPPRSGRPLVHGPSIAQSRPASSATRS